MNNSSKIGFSLGYILAFGLAFLLVFALLSPWSRTAGKNEDTSMASEPVLEMADRVFSLAKIKYEAMDARLADDRIPKSFVNGKPTDAPVEDWVSGFFPGSLWLIYKYTGDPRIKSLAEKNTLKLAGLPEKNTGHDIGFQINCSYGNAYRLTSDASWLPTIRKGAEALAARFSPVVGATKSWDGGEWTYPVIIDNMMNLEIFTFASGLFNEDSFMKMAKTHANTTIKNHFRPDYTTWHVVDYDPASGKVLAKKTHQGLSDDSAWARGQAWALYGFTMMYRETGETAYLKQAEGIAKMLLERLPADGIPVWDFDAPEDDVRDSSAGAIMASAFVELASLTKSRSLSGSCLAMAEKQLRTLSSPEYLAGPGENGDFLLRHGVGHKPKQSEVDTPLSYGDYYFLEALLRIVKK